MRKVQAMNDELSEDFICDDCEQACSIFEETIDFSGTHCTGGRDGTHRTGVYLSECCNADYKEG